MSLSAEMPSCGVLIEDHLGNRQSREIVREWCSGTDWHDYWERARTASPLRVVFEPIQEAFIIFTDNTLPSRGRRTSAGRRLAQYLQRYSLGTVIATKPTRNGNSGRDVQVFIFTPDNEALRRWFNA